jgi:signal peptidase II
MSAIGAIFALLAYIGDQGFKFMMLGVYDMDSWPYRRIPVTSFFEIVLAWNRGVSYGLFPQHTEAGRWLLIGISIITVAGLWLWMAGFRRPLPAAGVGLIIGGALANVTDRILHGAVADFFWFHIGRLSWYVFNLADVAIVVGVIMVLYDHFRGEQRRQDASAAGAQAEGEHMRGSSGRNGE